MSDPSGLSGTHEQQLPAWADPSVSPADLDAQGVSRRGLLRGAGLFGAAFAMGAAGSLTTPAAAGPQPYGGEDPRLAYLVGDHHIHSVYSHDAKYTFSQLAAAGAKYGLDWMVFTEHSNFGHADFGAALEHKEILRARAENPRQLIFQGLEWYIPAAEHCTVFTTPGRHEVDLLTAFERAYDGKLLNYTDGSAGGADTARNEAHAVRAIKWLAEQRRSGYVDDVLVLANHPLRLGIDSPHELRNWRDAAPEIMIGMEGAPGAQGAALPGWRGANSVRGEYENKPSAQSWPGYPAQAFLTYGGFDWATATVGGLWDAMLAEGRLFSVTTNSDAHRIVFDTWKNGDWPAGQNFDNTGKLPDPVDTDTPQPGSDFWPGQFSRTHVGVTRYGYSAVTRGLRAGRVWVDHGHLLDGLDVRLKRDRSPGRGVTLGGRLRVRKGEKLTLEVTVTTASRPNARGILPQLAHVDVVRGAVRGPVSDRDSWKAPATKVVHTTEVSGRKGTYTLRIPVTAGDESFYVRLRGSDGKRNGAGYLGASVDPHGPIPHEPGNGDPWEDTWFYSNPVFVDVR
ncbi:PHP domain-containing protein [Streptomyces scabiei]|uniref:PHP domain-containing protein n=1 Tax=Streptomyces scabiei TaxID=1930 RepID=UPI0004E671D3|nr:PHP domain-containing protein [Streptomyces scabiei]KFG02795.1 histidinol phosphatase [Streptomyces scabiei]MDX2836442.1 PHP domain-containing protein [Streptomyces scabiei]MDX3681250.1 PHP domain-containing protein [Streptomyces scabiei]